MAIGIGLSYVQNYVGIYTIPSAMILNVIDIFVAKKAFKDL
jgi:hypothetical protein